MSKPERADIEQPETRKENIVEKIGNRTICDPYRWLEKNDAEVETWVRAQHEYTLANLPHISGRERLRSRFEELMRVESFTIPIQKGNRYFYQACRFGRELPVLYVREGLEGVPRSLVDPNALSQDRTVTLKDTYFSDDGTLLVFGLSQTNNSHQSLHVLNVDRGEILEDVIPDRLYPIAQLWPAWNQLVWAANQSGFYYTRRPVEVPAGKEQYYQRLYFHALGSSYEEDTPIFGETLAEEQIPCPQLSRDGRYLIVTVLDASQTVPFSEIYVCDLERQHRRFFPIVKGLNALFQPKIHRDRIYFLTNYNAPRWMLVCVELFELEAAAIEHKNVKLQTIVPGERSHHWEMADRRRLYFR